VQPGSQIITSKPARPSLALLWASRKKLLNSSWLVALVVLMAFGMWIFYFLRAGHDIRDFVYFGTNYLEQSSVSPFIKLDPKYAYLPDKIGYDGQFCYYLAVDPANARYYMDDANYRYTRILYPMLARLVALGQPEAVPYTMVAINWLALAGGTLAVAAWFKRKGKSPWLALIFGLYPGFIISLQRDLTEILAYALVALAVYCFDFGGRRRVLWAGLSFGLACLARESVAVFPVVYGLALLFTYLQQEGQKPRLNWGKASGFLVLALLPLGLYKLFLIAWLGTLGLGAGAKLELIPLKGLLVYAPWQAGQVEQVRSVVVPALICLGLGLLALRQKLWQAEIWLMLANIILFVLMLPSWSYIDISASGRIAAGVVVAALFCLPRLENLPGGVRNWFWVASGFWLSLSLFWLFVPLVNNSLDLLKGFFRPFR